MFLVITLGFYVFFFFVFNTKVLPGVNNTFRAKFSQNQLLKNIFGLGQVGDSTTNYLGKGKGSIDLLFVETSRTTLRADSDSVIASEIEKITQKEATAKKVYGNQIEDFSDVYLEKVVGDIVSNEKSENPLVIMLLDKSKENPTEVGLAVNNRTILLYEGRIEELSETESIRADFERSTVLHEFGHLLGLEHNEEEGCLMNEIVESPGNNLMISLPRSFCEFELSEIEKMREN